MDPTVHVSCTLLASWLNLPSTLDGCTVGGLMVTVLLDSALLLAYEPPLRRYFTVWLPTVFAVGLVVHEPPSTLYSIVP